MKKPCKPSKKRTCAAVSSSSGDGEPPSKKPNVTASSDKKSSGSSASVNRVWPFKFHSVDEQWQRSACVALGLEFQKANGVSPGGSSMPLTRPNMRKIKEMAIACLGPCLVW